MEISSLAYIIVGIITASFSWYINKLKGYNQLALFFYIGIVLIVFGLIKYFILRKSPKKIEPKRPEVQFSNYCRRCGQQVNIFDNFCPRCGMYLKAGDKLSR